MNCKIKYGEYYNYVSRKDYVIIRFYQLQLLIRRFRRYIILITKEWFNLTFVISTVSVLVFLISAYYIGNYYKGYGLRKTLWENKSILFTFLVAPNLIKFSINANRKKSNALRRNDMYWNLYSSFENIFNQYLKDKLEINYIEGCLYTKDGFEDMKNQVNVVKIYSSDFITFCEKLEEELPIVKISKEIEFYFSDETEIRNIKKIIETYERRYKLIKIQNNGASYVIIDTIWEIMEYYYEFIQCFSIDDKYKVDIDIQRKIVHICMKIEYNHKHLKSQYYLANMSRIGYEIPDSDYDYG